MSEPIVVTGPQELSELVGQHLGYSEYHEITQGRVDGFAEATGDYQWIHVDPVRAAAGPFGAPIAHGFLTLSILPTLKDEILDIRGFSTAINYGCERVRFPAPVRVGDRIRAGMVINHVSEIGGGVQVQTTMTCTVENNDKPSCVASMLTRFYD